MTELAAHMAVTKTVRAIAKRFIISSSVSCLSIPFASGERGAVMLASSPGAGCVQPLPRPQGTPFF